MPSSHHSATVRSSCQLGLEMKESASHGYKTSLESFDGGDVINVVSSFSATIIKNEFKFDLGTQKFTFGLRHL